MKHLHLYNTFISERYSNSRRVELSIDEAVSMYLNKCSDWDLFSNKQIYRGTTGITQFFYVNPKNSNDKRMPANLDSSGYYQGFFDNIESWKKAPKRTQSLIMSTSRLDAIRFSYSDDDNPEDDGGLYIMIPYNNTNIGMCSEYDLWESFPVIGKYMKSVDVDGHLANLDREMEDFFSNNLSDEDLDKYYEHIRNRYSTSGKIYRAKDVIHDVKNICDAIDKIPKDKLKFSWLYHPEHTYEIISNWGKTNVSFYKFIEGLLNFDDNNFEIINNQSQLVNRKEVWSDGEFLCIKDNNFEAFKNKLKEIL